MQYTYWWLGSSGKCGEGEGSTAQGSKLRWKRKFVRCDSSLCQTSFLSVARTDYQNNTIESEQEAVAVVERARRATLETVY